MKGQQSKRNPGLSVPSALRYFLKGNLMFVVSGMVTYAIGNAIALLPPLFQQVYTDNIITHKNPEWFTPLIVLYILLFVLELAAWISLSIQDGVVDSLFPRRTGGALYRYPQDHQNA